MELKEVSTIPYKELLRENHKLIQENENLQDENENLLGAYKELLLENLSLKEKLQEDDDMTCRRKTKSSRELLADINKTFAIFCNSNKCHECKYRFSEYCELDWLIDLILKNKEE